MRRDRVTIFAVEKQQVLNIMNVCVCLYSFLSYAACKSHLLCAVLYRNLWPVWLDHIFPHYLVNGTIFGETLLNIKCLL
jgi:hypothetical protein